jgi:DNA-binding LacI/PurR family transcriptional regulator
VPALIIDRNSPIPQYFQLQTWLIEQIEQGVFKPDDKIPTEAELSQVTGLARATIRQAIQNLVNMGYLNRRRRLGTFVLKRRVDEPKKTIIGLLLPDIRVGYAPILARGAEDESARSGHSLILCNTDDLFIKADFHADRLINHAVSGVIFVPTAAEDDKNFQIIDKFTRKKIPVVIADRVLSGKKNDYVTTDNFKGGYELTKYLINKGHTRIAITLSDCFSTERERLAGYKKAHIDFNLPLDPDIIKIHSGPYTEKPYAQYARKFLKNRDITAIFAGQDRVAFDIYSVAEDMQRLIPGDVSLVGYDDLRPSCPHMVSLTTMHQPIYEIGVECMKLIKKRIRGDKRKPHQIVLKSTFVERDSVREISKTEALSIPSLEKVPI